MKPRTDLLKFPHYELIVSLSSIGLPWLARGKQLTSSRTVHGTKREALRLKREIEREIDPGKARPNTEISIEQYLERWLEDEVSISNAPRTQYDYRLIVERQLIPELGRLRLRHLRAQHVLALRTKLFESGGKNGKPLSKRRVQYVLAVLKKALSDAVELGLLAENVAKRVKLPRPDRKPVEPLTESRLQMVAGAIPVAGASSSGAAESGAGGSQATIATTTSASAANRDAVCQVIGLLPHRLRIYAAGA